MLIGGVIGHPIDDDFDAAPMGFGHQPIERGEIPKKWINIAVVGYIVAKVFHRRRIKRAEPDRLHAQRSRCAVVQIIQPFNNTGQIADTVLGGILKTARVDLIDDAALPPMQS